MQTINFPIEFLDTLYRICEILQCDPSEPVISSVDFDKYSDFANKKKQIQEIGRKLELITFSLDIYNGVAVQLDATRQWEDGIREEMKKAKMERDDVPF